MTMPSAFRALLAVGVLLGLTACASLGSAPPALPSGVSSGTLTAPPSSQTAPATTQPPRPTHTPRTTRATQQPRVTQTPPASKASQVTQAPPTTHAPTPTQAAPAGCYPKTNAGNCYEPGEFCRTTDRGTSGVAGDGERIRCEDNDGWRWEPI